MRILHCERAHVPAVLELLAGRAGEADRLRELQAEFEGIYFDNPWTDARFPSLVCEIDGRIVGFLGVTPRPLRLGERPLAAAVCSNFRVADDAPPGRRPFVAAQLVKTALAGPQDLSVADGANALSRRIWEGLGGIAAPLHSLDWMAPLRPAGALLELARIGEQRSPSLAAALRGAARLADLALPRFAAARSAGAARTEPIDIAELDAIAPQPMDRLAAVHAPVSRRWVVETARRLAFDREVQVRRVVGPDGKVLGGYVLVRRNPHLADLLEIRSVAGEPATLLGAILEDVARAGLALVRGHAEAAFFQAYRDLRCLLNTGRWTIVHSRDRSLLAPFREGRAALSALDGERWIGSFELAPQGHQRAPRRPST